MESFRWRYFYLGSRTTAEHRQPVYQPPKPQWLPSERSSVPDSPRPRAVPDPLWPTPSDLPSASGLPDPEDLAEALLWLHAERPEQGSDRAPRSLTGWRGEGLRGNCHARLAVCVPSIPTRRSRSTTRTTRSSGRRCRSSRPPPPRPTCARRSPTWHRARRTTPPCGRPGRPEPSSVPSAGGAQVPQNVW